MAPADLYEEEEVRIPARGRRPVSFPDMVVLDIDTHLCSMVCPLKVLGAASGLSGPLWEETKIEKKERRLPRTAFDSPIQRKQGQT